MVKFENVRWEKIFLLVWLIVNLSIGALTVRQYGISVDEPNNYRYADDTLAAYPSFFGARFEPYYDSSYDGHGPAFLSMAGILIRGVQVVFPNVFPPDLWHFSYFITFQLTGVCLYWLAKRWFSKWTAWGILILFTSQPLLWGQAFINPKDIPFMFFFTLSIVLGFRLLDRAEINKSVDFFLALRSPHTILAGVTLGLATAVRPIAPFAGLIVFLFLFAKIRFKGWAIAFAYFLTAGITTYLFWPYLWKSPITKFFLSLKTTSGFPVRGPVLFMGNIYSTNHLPRRYFPTLLGLQLTEPALFLILIGFVAALYLLMKSKNREPVLLFAIWFLPLTLWVVGSRSALYDNARHLLFLWPSLFILAGLGMDQLIALIKPPLARVILVVAIVAPGLYASVQLNPYQYIYYNSLVGGVKGAYRSFELDYWALSFKESMDYLNKNAEQGAMILVIGARPIAEQYARPDLIIVGPDEVDPSQNLPYYILASTRANKDGSYCGDTEAIFDVERNGGVLSVIKKIPAGQICK